jgi:hypothetical protein
MSAIFHRFALPSLTLKRRENHCCYVALPHILATTTQNAGIAASLFASSFPKDELMTEFKIVNLCMLFSRFAFLHWPPSLDMNPRKTGACASPLAGLVAAISAPPPAVPGPPIGNSPVICMRRFLEDHAERSFSVDIGFDCFEELHQRPLERKAATCRNNRVSYLA